MPSINITPGLGLCLIITVLAFALQQAEFAVFETRFLDPFTTAILAGIALKSTDCVPINCTAGIQFCSKRVLEIAIVVLGLTVDFNLMLGSGFQLILAILGLVLVMIAVSFTICLAFGISEKMAILVACGNAICGNAAIAAVAPAIKAKSEDVVITIAFSAILGVIFVIFLPFLAPFLSMSEAQYGTFAGLTVYAVPQVVAATAPVSLSSAQIGMSVKLIRVLMLVPVVISAPLLMRNRNTPSLSTGRPYLATAKILPWFVPLFVIASFGNTSGLISKDTATTASTVSCILFVVAMAGLGLGVDARTLSKTKFRLVASIILSLTALSATAYFIALRVV
ncbi:MAG: putative sulfate exporter family transporter [Roseibium sp.]